jgi:hypothetical protein
MLILLSLDCMQEVDSHVDTAACIDEERRMSCMRPATRINRNTWWTSLLNVVQWRSAGHYEMSAALLVVHSGFSIVHCTVGT